MTYGIIGVGALAAAIVTGLCEQGRDPSSILLSPRNAGVANGLAARLPGVRVAASNQAVVDGATVLVLCLRPQDARAALQGLRFPEAQSIVSVMAGIPLDALRDLVAPATDIARAIPLPTVATRGSVTPVCPPTGAATALFDGLGAAVEIPDETAFEAASAATATIAAHFAYLDTISRWLVAQGVSEVAARRHVASTFAGLGGELRDGRPDLESLARAHATRGGINEQFLGVLTQARVFDAVNSGLDRVLDRLTGRT